jgi:hypothetical protein
MKKLALLALLIGGAVLLTVMPTSLQWTPTKHGIYLDKAEAYTYGRARRVTRRVYRRSYRRAVRYGAYAAGTTAGYYSGYGYPSYGYGGGGYGYPSYGYGGGYYGGGYGYGGGYYGYSRPLLGFGIGFGRWW